MSTTGEELDVSAPPTATLLLAPAAAAPALVPSAPALAPSAAYSAMHTATPRLMASWNAAPDIAGATVTAESRRSISAFEGRM